MLRASEDEQTAAKVETAFKNAKRAVASAAAASELEKLIRNKTAFEWLLFIAWQIVAAGASVAFQKTTIETAAASAAGTLVLAVYAYYRSKNNEYATSR